MSKSRKQIILNTVEDLVGSFVYYDRKEDEDLPRDAIESAIRHKEITIDEISDHFHDQLVLHLQNIS